jgi:cysteine desulfuration protein SufE
VSGSVSERIEGIIAEFAELEPRERLELLLEFAEKLAPLPPEYQAQRDAGMNRVHECQTPVFLWTEIVDGKVRILADVAPESPTVKGFVSILSDLYTSADPAEVLAAPVDIVQRFGLTEALGMVRMRGLQAIAHHMRSKIADACAG